MSEYATCYYMGHRRHVEISKERRNIMNEISGMKGEMPRLVSLEVMLKAWQTLGGLSPTSVPFILEKCKDATCLCPEDAYSMLIFDPLHNFHL